MSPLLFLLLLAKPPDRDAVEASVRRVLAEETYTFCHDPEYPLDEDEVAWCPLTGGMSRRCPALPEACRAGAQTLGARGRRLGSGRGSARGRHGAGGGTRGEGEADEEPRFLRLPRLGGLGQAFLWLFVAAALGAVVYAVAKNLWRAPRDEPPPELGGAAATAAAAAAAGGPIETDVERLLARARAAAARGEYARAIDDAYAAALRRLDGEGLIRIHAWRTNGDYLRDLSKKPELRGEVRKVVWDVEQVQFGARAASVEVFEAVLGRVLPIALKQGGALVLLFGLGLFALSLSSCGFRTRGPFDDSPSGRRAVFEVLAQGGLKPVHRRAPLDKMGSDASTLVLLPGAPVDRKSWPHLLDWVERSGSVLVVATGERRLPERLKLELDEALAKGAEARAGAAFREGPYRDLTVAVPGRRSLRVTGSDGAARAKTLLDRGGAIYAAWIEIGEGLVVVLPDDDLFVNASLAVADNAAFVTALLHELDEGPLEFADELTGAAPANPVAAVARGRLAPTVAQLGLLVLLYFLYRGVAFGRPRDPPPPSRRSFADHVRALGVQYAKARASRHVFSLYSAYALERLRERLPVGGRRGLHPLAEAVAARTGRDVGQVMRILVEAQSAREVSGVRAVPQEDLPLLRELADLLAHMGGVSGAAGAEGIALGGQGRVSSVPGGSR